MRARSNPDSGPWLVAGGVAVGIIGLVWLLTRSPSSASASTATSQAPTPTPGPFQNYGTPYTPTVTGPRADYQITAANTSVSLKVGQILAIAQPHPAGPNQNWQVIIYPPQSAGVVTFQDAAVKDLGWQPDYTDMVQPTAPGGSTVVMNLVEETHGDNVETYSVAITASA